MCLTSQALALFLTMIGPDVVTTAPGAVIVHADEGDVLWLPVADTWCTDAPGNSVQAQAKPNV